MVQGPGYYYVNIRNIRGHLITLLTPELTFAYFIAIQILDPWNLQQHPSLQPWSSEPSQVQRAAFSTAKQIGVGVIARTDTQ